MRRPFGLFTLIALVLALALLLADGWGLRGRPAAPANASAAQADAPPAGAPRPVEGAAPAAGAPRGARVALVAPEGVALPDDPEDPR